MADERETLRDWHRLFGLLLADFFADSPFVVEVERDLWIQQQFLDVVIVRRGKGRFTERLPDGLEGLRTHNLVTFKSHHESLDDWAMKELIGHFVAYRKFVSPSPTDLLAEDRFGLYAVVARFPQQLSSRIPWERVLSGVYDARWGTDTVRVVVARELPKEPHNAPLHLFSAQPELIQFGGRSYRKRSNDTSDVLNHLLAGFQSEGIVVYTMKDFRRDWTIKNFAELSDEERAEVLRKMPLEQILAALPAEQIREYLERKSAEQPAPARKPKRKK